ncbi:MAG: glycerol-3-phosphate 1-O-acyltransferase PlsY [Acetobacteraceae bacterium]
MSVTLSLAAILGSYLLGAIPFGLLLTRMAGLGDIRAVGSGNIGATNVLRTGRRDIAALTLILDAAKGAAAVLAFRHWGGEIAGLLAGVAAVVGHCTSPFVGFRGGKGVATGLGIMLAWSWAVGLACLAIWLVAAILSKRSSLASLATLVVAPVLLYVAGGWEPAGAGLLACALVLGRHRQNIARLLAGTEPRIGQSPETAGK